MSSACDLPRRLVIGVGNPDRGDDGVGSAVARLLRGRLARDVRIETANGDTAALIELMRCADWMFIVDAMVSGRPAGSVLRIDCVGGDTLPLPPETSSHGFGVAHAVALARVLGCLPQRCVILAVEAGGLAPGTDLSPPVAAAAEYVAHEIVAAFGAP